MELVEISEELARDMGKLSFSEPAAYVYNPLEYAMAPHRQYLERYGQGNPEVLFIGMNPGPWGMAQTGVPFGAISPVRDWLGIDAEVDKPPRENPKRPVEGFACRREEVSGARLWGWAQESFGTPERFFERFFVANYCPLLFIEGSGKNVVPEKLVREERESILPPCDHALRRTSETLGVSWVIGVGAYAQKRAKKALDGLDVEIGTILHPSPASPAANRGWGQKASEQLRALGIDF